MSFISSDKFLQHRLREELTSQEFLELERLGPFAHPQEAIIVAREIIRKRKIDISPEEWVGAA